MKQINEKYGIVRKSSHKWDNLANAIVDYLYDATGLMNDFDLLDDNEVTLSMIKIFYKDSCHISELPADFVPEWLNDFSLYIDDKTDNYANGYVNLSKLTYEDDGKLNGHLYISFNLAKPRKMNSIANTIMHEFRHLYTAWLENKYDFKITNEKNKYLYNLFKKISNNIQIKNKNQSFEYRIAELPYLLFPDEINAFMESYNKECIDIISKNIDKVKIYVNNLKSGKNIRSNDPNYPDISPLDLHSYKIYSDALIFINDMSEKLNNKEIDRDELVDVIFDYDLRDLMNAYLLNDEKQKKEIDKILDTNINFIYMEDDTADDIYVRSYYVLADFILKYLKKIKPHIEKVI